MPRRSRGRRRRRGHPPIRGQTKSRPVSSNFSIKVAVGMIVYNGAFVLREALASLYPFVEQIVIAEGPVAYFANKGAKRSTDGTVEIIQSFPDPQGKITMVHGPWVEKDEMVNGYVRLLRPDINYIWHQDSDEVFKTEDVRTILGLLPDYDSVGFRSITFYGGFDRYLTGFEQIAEFERIKRWPPGAKWATHRPPTVIDPTTGKPMRDGRHLRYDTLAGQGIYMYHYSYVWPDQIRQKTPYIHDALAQGRCIDGYYERVYEPWVAGDAAQKQAIEDEFLGVHDFLPSFRGECRTELFEGEHPEPIARRLPGLRQLLRSQL